MNLYDMIDEQMQFLKPLSNAKQMHCLGVILSVQILRVPINYMLLLATTIQWNMLF